MNSILNRASAMGFEDYHPGYIIQAVNALLPLGKEKALEQVNASLGNRVKGRPATGLFWLLRVLFDLPAGLSFPPVHLGKPAIPPPTDPQQLVRFPIVLVRDIPFLVVSGYRLRGLPEPVEAHVAYFREYGLLRRHALAPPASMEGVQAEFLYLWKNAYGDRYTAAALEMITAQIARLGSV